VKHSRPFERRDGENPYQVQRDLQDTMQDLVGIVRNEREMREALEKIDDLKKARGKGPQPAAIVNTTPVGILRSI